MYTCKPPPDLRPLGRGGCGVARGDGGPVRYVCIYIYVCIYTHANHHPLLVLKVAAAAAARAETAAQCDMYVYIYVCMYVCAC